MFRPNSGHRQVYNSSAVRVLQYASGIWNKVHIVILLQQTNYKPDDGRC
jgi:hypothetical protein